MTGKKGKMTRTLVWYSVGVLTVAAVWGMVVKTIEPTADLSDVLAFVGGAFGFELLALLLKRLFANPKKERNSDE